MIARNCLALQAATLLKLAKISSDPKTAAGLAAKAAELQAKASEVPEPTAPTPPEASAHS